MTGYTVITATFVAPMDRPLIQHGAVAFADGRILAVGPRDGILTQHPAATRIDCGDAVILPGLVNAHTHLELSACQSGDGPGGGFDDWIMSMPARIGRICNDRDEAFVRGAHEGIAQCLRFGVTAIGDISQQFHLTRPILRESPLRVVSYGEAIGLGGRRERFEMLMRAAIEPEHATERLRIGLTPHAPYTVDRVGYEQCLALARRHQLPLATHLAETPDETEFLLHQTGLFRGVWDKLAHWRDDVPLAAEPPVGMAASLGLLDYPTLLAHVNYCDDVDIARLADGRASVVWCPRTHRYFGHPPHRWRDMLDAGVNVAIGTDSCASSPDLNLLDDVRVVRRTAPDLPPHLLLEMVTTRAAAALQWADQLGSLTSGKWADLAVFSITSADPLRELLDDALLPSQVWIGGKRIAPSDTM